MSPLFDRLIQIGLPEPDAREAADRWPAVAHALKGEPEGLWWVPGRIEILGKHTDYVGGQSLTCAVSKGFLVAWRRATSATVTMVDADAGNSEVLELSAKAEAPMGTWANYPATVVRRTVRDFGARQGVRIAFASTLPQEAGMSSSSALVVGTFLALAEANDLLGQPDLRDRSDLATYLASVESGRGWRSYPPDFGVGTTGGSEDHVAILCGRPGRLGRYRYVPTVALQQVPWPSEWQLFVLHSGVLAPKTGGAREKYNRIARIGGEVADYLCRQYEFPGSLGQLAERVPPRELLEKVANNREWSARLMHFLHESESLVPAVAEAIANQRVETVRELVRQSQPCDGLAGVHVKEVTDLRKRMDDLGAIGVSPFGAGFGGSLWAAFEGEDATAQVEEALIPGSRVFRVAAGPCATPLLPFG